MSTATIEELATLDSMGISTVQELIKYALDRGTTPSELLARVSAGAPEGFTRVYNEGIETNCWEGPSVRGDGWEVQTGWDADMGVLISLVHPTSDLDPAQALAAGKALAETSAKYV